MHCHCNILITVQKLQKRLLLAGAVGELYYAWMLPSLLTIARCLADAVVIPCRNNTVTGLKDVDCWAGWYKTCTEALQRYQSESVTHDEEIRQQERQQYIKELEAELKDLKEADVGSGAEGLLRHIYKTYPPKNPEHKLDDEDLDDRDKVKKALLTAVLHYHPDKQDTGQHGRKWTVLCEEITRLLNGHYETYKFPPNEETE